MKKMMGWLGSVFARQADAHVENRPDDDEFKIELPSRAEVAASMKSQESAQDDHRATVPDLENLDIHLSDHNKPTE